MILTVTPAPGLDRTYRAVEMLEGRVNRAISSEIEASGKGVNVSRALAAAGVATVAILPLGGPEGRHLADLLTAEAVSYHAIQTDVPTRANTTLAILGHSTTKMNAPSPELPEAVWDELKRIVEDLVRQHPDAWVLCAGSVPTGADWLPAQLIKLARRCGARSAVDSSGTALAAALLARPDLIAPNHLELAELVGVDAKTLDPDGHDSTGTSLVEMVSPWARQLSAQIGGAVLATLGAGGAVYADRSGSWHGIAPAIVPLNTVGAGDALLAGFLSVAGLADPGHVAAAGGALATAVAWGTAACAMASTSGDVAARADVAAVRITALC